MDLTALYAWQKLAVAASEGSEQPLVAQMLTVIITFIAVVWVLKMFAFEPILQVIDERRNKIAADLKKAEDLQKKAEAEHAATEERLRNVEAEARGKMQELIAEGKKVAQSIQEKARQDAEALMTKAQQNIRLETEKARVELKEEVVKLTLMATEHLIKERLDDDKHRQLIGNFISDIERN